MRQVLRDRVGEVATLETDTFYMMIDPTWSIPWPEAKKYFEVALRNLVSTATNLVEAGFEWVAVGSNGLNEKEPVRAFVDLFRDGVSTDIHHITLDPGVEAVQKRIKNRADPLDESKTNEWLESQLLWFRERYGDWTHVIDNQRMTPEETALAIQEAVEQDAGKHKRRS